jgi:hypothetical protein
MQLLQWQDRRPPNSGRQKLSPSRGRGQKEHKAPSHSFDSHNLSAKRKGSRRGEIKNDLTAWTVVVAANVPRTNPSAIFSRPGGLDVFVQPTQN